MEERRSDEAEMSKTWESRRGDQIQMCTRDLSASGTVPLAAAQTLQLAANWQQALSKGEAA